jgi:hypothetical protein
MNLAIPCELYAVSGEDERAVRRIFRQDSIRRISQGYMMIPAFTD